MSSWNSAICSHQSSHFKFQGLPSYLYHLLLYCWGGFWILRQTSCPWPVLNSKVALPVALRLWALYTHISRFQRSQEKKICPFTMCAVSLLSLEESELSLECQWGKASQMTTLGYVVLAYRTDGIYPTLQERTRTCWDTEHGSLEVLAAETSASQFLRTNMRDIILFCSLQTCRMAVISFWCCRVLCLLPGTCQVM